MRLSEIFTSIILSIDYVGILSGLGPLGFPCCLCLNLKLTKTKKWEIKGNEEKKEREGGFSFWPAAVRTSTAGPFALGLAAENPTPVETDFPYQAWLRWFPALQKLNPPSTFFPSSIRLTSLPTLIYYLPRLLLPTLWANTKLRLNTITNLLRCNG